MRRLIRRPKIALRLFLLTAVMIALIGYYNERSKTHQSTTAAINGPILTEERQMHILTGGETGGGHLFGAGKPCKSEFPSSWNADKVLAVVREIAANDNLPWKKEDNGYYVAETRKDGVWVRVVLNEDRTKIITGYPTNMPRNPCPPANDNFNP